MERRWKWFGIGFEGINALKSKKKEFTFVNSFFFTFLQVIVIFVVHYMENIVV